MNMRVFRIAVSVAAVAAGGAALVATGGETRAGAGYAAAQSGTANDVHGGDASYEPTRISKAIELLERDQPIYYTQVNAGGYEEGKALARTWADYITYNMEHSPFDMNALRAFMQGLVDGGPTRSGHRTPAVVAVLPFGGINEQVMWANYWMVEQVLGAGVHGVLLAHARSPEVVRVLVQSARYPHAPEAKGVDEGLRGNGGQGFAAHIWGLTNAEYQRRADAWPLNPEGELLIGLKIEDRHALENAEASTAVPGVGFAEWGPGDMSLSFDVSRGDAPQVLTDARARVLAATKQAGIPFLNRVRADDIEQMIDEGVRIGSNPGAEGADRGRRYTNRRMPW
ncbi:MAG: aldolase/citrate lyase family protein [Acidobacteria bacterium]|nr:aldolase/citrate lyase family protein [Acidobacteriota bacterium]